MPINSSGRNVHRGRRMPGKCESIQPRRPGEQQSSQPRRSRRGRANRVSDSLSQLWISEAATKGSPPAESSQAEPTADELVDRVSISDPEPKPKPKPWPIHFVLDPRKCAPGYDPAVPVTFYCDICGSKEHEPDFCPYTYKMPPDSTFVGSDTHDVICIWCEGTDISTDPPRKCKTCNDSAALRVRPKYHLSSTVGFSPLTRFPFLDLDYESSLGRSEIHS